ncbi:MAG: DUF4184 family protein [Thermoplasmata archaeon]
MPIAVLHWPTVWPLFAHRPARFDFFALSVGSVIPDLECPFLYILTWDRWKSRGLMHSLLGSITVDLGLTIALVLFAVPPLLRKLEGRLKNKRWFFFAGVDLRSQKPSIFVTSSSALIGTVSHVLLDTLHHPYNPLSFPVESYYGFNLVPFGDFERVGWIVQLSMLALLLAMLYFYYFRQQARGAGGK